MQRCTVNLGCVGEGGREPGLGSSRSAAPQNSALRSFLLSSSHCRACPELLSTGETEAWMQPNPLVLQSGSSPCGCSSGLDEVPAIGFPKGHPV